MSTDFSDTSSSRTLTARQQEIVKSIGFMKMTLHLSANQASVSRLKKTRSPYSFC